MHVTAHYAHFNLFHDFLSGWGQEMSKISQEQPAAQTNRFGQALLQQSGQEKLLHHRPSYSLLKGGEERVLIFLHCMRVNKKGHEDGPQILQILYPSSVTPIKASIYGKRNHPKCL